MAKSYLFPNPVRGLGNNNNSSSISNLLTAECTSMFLRRTASYLNGGAAWSNPLAPNVTLLLFFLTIYQTSPIEAAGSSALSLEPTIFWLFLAFNTIPAKPAIILPSVLLYQPLAEETGGKQHQQQPWYSRTFGQSLAPHAALAVTLLQPHDRNRGVVRGPPSQRLLR